MILVLSRDGDEHADAVEAQLRLLDAPVLRFDPGRYPGECELSVRVGAGGRIGAVLRYQGAEIDLTRVDAVLVAPPEPPPRAAVAGGHRGRPADRGGGVRAARRPLGAA